MVTNDNDPTQRGVQPISNTYPRRLVLEQLLKQRKTGKTHADALAQRTGLAGPTVRGILVRLERKGWVEVTPDAFSPTAAGGRPRNYYSLTGSGRREAVKLLRGWKVGPRRSATHGTLSAIRSALGLTQVTVVHRMGLSPSAVSLLENRHNLRVGTLAEYTRALDVYMRIIFGDVQLVLPGGDSGIEAAPPSQPGIDEAQRTNWTDVPPGSTPIKGSLSQIRESLYFTTTEIADGMGVGQSRLWKIETEPNPTVATLARYAAALGEELRIVIGDMTLILPATETPATRKATQPDE